MFFLYSFLCDVCHLLCQLTRKNTLLPFFILPFLLFPFLSLAQKSHFFASSPLSSIGARCPLLLHASHTCLTSATSSPHPATIASSPPPAAATRVGLGAVTVGPTSSPQTPSLLLLRRCHPIASPAHCRAASDYHGELLPLSSPSTSTHHRSKSPPSASPREWRYVSPMMHHATTSASAGSGKLHPPRRQRTRLSDLASMSSSSIAGSSALPRKTGRGREGGGGGGRWGR